MLRASFHRHLSANSSLQNTEGLQRCSKLPYRLTDLSRTLLDLSRHSHGLLNPLRPLQFKPKQSLGLAKRGSKRFGLCAGLSHVELLVEALKAQGEVDGELMNHALTQEEGLAKAPSSCDMLPPLFECRDKGKGKLLGIHIEHLFSCMMYTKRYV